EIGVAEVADSVTVRVALIRVVGERAVIRVRRDVVAVDIDVAIAAEYDVARRGLPGEADARRPYDDVVYAIGVHVTGVAYGKSSEFVVELTFQSKAVAAIELRRIQYRRKPRCAEHDISL